MNKPYVGITGVTTEAELDYVLATYEANGFSSKDSHVGMVGFLASKSTAPGGKPRSGRHVADTKTLVELAAKSSSRALSVVHFECRDLPDTFSGLLLPLLDQAYDEGLRAAQLNATPSPDEVNRVRDAYPELTLIYQIRPDLLAHGPDAVLAEIGKHRGAFQYLLIDPSCGTGRDIDLPQAVLVAEALSKEFPDSSVGFAGGFSGENVEGRVKNLVESMRHCDFSIDVEGKVREPTTDLLDASRVEAYIQGASRGFQNT
jgi:phosphoribosylanthranilate isomerase